MHFENEDRSHHRASCHMKICQLISLPRSTSQVPAVEPVSDGEGRAVFMLESYISKWRDIYKLSLNEQTLLTLCLAAISWPWSPVTFLRWTRSTLLATNTMGKASLQRKGQTHNARELRHCISKPPAVVSKSISEILSGSEDDFKDLITSVKLSDVSYFWNTRLSCRKTS